jgi:hypothetical protein
VLTTWMLVAVGAGILATAVVPGIWLWWPARGNASSRSDLGVALMTGTLVAFSVLIVQVLYESRASRLEGDQRAAQVTRDRRMQQQAERQSLALAVGLQHDLRELDLRGRDLSGFFLVRKQLQEAQLSGARLDESVLTGSNLTGAALVGARLRQAVLDDARLVEAVLSRADLEGAYLRGTTLREADLSAADLRGADMEGATLRGAALGGAKYDATTKWPAHTRVRPCPTDRICVVGGADLAVQVRPS